MSAVLTPGSERNAPGFLFAQAAHRERFWTPHRNSPSFASYHKSEGGNRLEKSDARLQPYIGRAEIALVGLSPILIV